MKIKTLLVCLLISTMISCKAKQDNNVDTGSVPQKVENVVAEPATESLTTKEPEPIQEPTPEPEVKEPEIVEVKKEIVTLPPKIYEKAVDLAVQYEGLKELTNHNDGPEITKWLKNVGLGPGYPYCAAFMYSMYSDAKKELGSDATLTLKSARCSSVYYNARSNPIKYKIITPNEIFLGIETLRIGDIPIWTRSPDNVKNFNGHTGLVIEQLNNKQFKTIEANTRSDNVGDQGEGGGVFLKTRNVNSTSFKIKGFIRLNIEE
jgi:hypothetical protein